MRKKTSEVEVLEPIEDELYKNVRSIIAKGRAKVYVAANTALVETYWKVGREIVEKQGGFGRATYGNGLIDSLARRLTAEFGSGYTRSNLRNMRQFYTYFQNCHTVCGKLNWSHFRTLITNVEYTLNEHERNLFAVKYHLHLPTVEELQMELQRERAAIEEAMLLTGKCGKKGRAK